jgi:membrane-anchored protein YejM (alkaline phosphatase superfamily)
LSSDAQRGLAPAAGDPDLKPGAIDLLLLVTIDCLREKDFRSDTMPALSRFARRGLLLARTYSAGTRTSVSLSLLHHRMISERPSVAERLTAERIESTLIMSLAEPAYGEGFTRFDTPAQEWYSAKEVTDRALTALAMKRSRPHFLWLHYVDAIASSSGCSARSSATASWRAHWSSSPPITGRASASTVSSFIT